MSIELAKSPTQANFSYEIVYQRHLEWEKKPEIDYQTIYLVNEPTHKELIDRFLPEGWQLIDSRIMRLAKDDLEWIDEEDFYVIPDEDDEWLPEDDWEFDEMYDCID